MGIIKLNQAFRIKAVLFFSLFFSGSLVFSQEILNPLIKDKSHESLNISSISISDSATVVIVTGSRKAFGADKFCINKKAHIKESKNDFKRLIPGDTLIAEASKKYTLLKYEGIPGCADKDTIKYKGDTVDFKLIFPKLNQPLGSFIDLESESFQFEGICLKDSLAYEVSTYQQAFAEFETGSKDSALILFKKIIDFHDTINNMYENAFINIPIIYESNGDKKKAITWYKNLLASELRDDELIEEGGSKYANFKHRSCLRLASIYKSMGKYEESLKYIWLADTLHTLKDKSAIIISKQNALLLLDKILNYDALKAYDDALFYGIQQIINEENPNVYNAHSKMLVEMIKQNYDYKKFVADFDKALQQLVVFDEEKQVIGKFKFMEKEYELKINKDYTIMVSDPKTNQLVKAGIQDKNQAFFIKRVKISDFYLRLISKS